MPKLWRPSGFVYVKFVGEIGPAISGPAPVFTPRCRTTFAILHLNSPSEGVIKCPHEHHPNIRYMVYNGYYRVMSNIPKMGHLPTPGTPGANSQNINGAVGWYPHGKFMKGPAAWFFCLETVLSIRGFPAMSRKKELRSAIRLDFVHIYINMYIYIIYICVYIHSISIPTATIYPPVIQHTENCRFSAMIDIFKIVMFGSRGELQRHGGTPKPWISMLY